MSKKITKIVAFIALFWILLSIIWTWVLIIYETYFSQNQNYTVEIWDDYFDFINSLPDEELEELLIDIDNNLDNIQEQEFEDIYEENNTDYESN